MKEQFLFYLMNFNTIGVYYAFEEYFSVVIFFFSLLFFCILLLSFAFIISLKSYDIEKNSPYECGFNPFNDAREPFEIQFYLVGILFIIFDLEISFLIPWILIFRVVIGSYLIGIIFILILTVGFIYELYKGSLQWT